MRYLDRLEKPALLERYSETHLIQQWLASTRPYTDALCYPRMRSLKLPELGLSQTLKDFEESRKQLLGISLDEASQQTDRYISTIAPYLEQLSQRLNLDAYLSKQRDLCFNDIAAFAELRNLSMVHELALSDELNRFVHILSNRSRIPLFSRVNKAGIVTTRPDLQ